MNKLTVSNPLQEALRQTQGLDRVGGQYRSMGRRCGFCWDCLKDKPKAGSRMFGSGNNQRFKCLNKTQAAKAAL